MMEPSPSALVKEHLKVLLVHFAKHSETPGAELDCLLREVIQELYDEAEEKLAQQIRDSRRLKLIVNNA